MNTATLLISCLDKKGITSKVTGFVFENGGNILDANQHIDEQTNTFFMRIKWDLNGFRVPRNALADTFNIIAQDFDMTWTLSFGDKPKRVAIFASKQLHCLYDLLYRYKSRQLSCEIPIVVSNHLDAAEIAESFDIPFAHISKTSECKKKSEAQELELMMENNIDLIVLARYHQVFTSDFVDQYASRMINIHHSFLPAFAGANPYAQAYKKGVKIIGATSHYVTKDLDQGPIIEQDTVRVSHQDALSEMKLRGEDLERVVLSRAVRWHLDDRILVYNNKTVVF